MSQPSSLLSETLSPPQSSKSLKSMILPLALAALSGALGLAVGPDLGWWTGLAGLALWSFFAWRGTAAGGRDIHPGKLEAFIAEIRTIPAIQGNLRMEFRPKSEATWALLAELPFQSRKIIEGFIERATRRSPETGTPSPVAAAATVSPAVMSRESKPLVVTPKPSAPQPASGVLIDTIVIDDSDSVHKEWKVAAGKMGRTVLTFKNVEALLGLPGIAKIPTDTRIVVAHQVGGARGIQASKTLAERGFRNLVLAHPTPEKLLEPTPTWIRRVIAKSPIFD